MEEKRERGENEGCKEKKMRVRGSSLTGDAYHVFK